MLPVGYGVFCQLSMDSCGFCSVPYVTMSAEERTVFGGFCTLLGDRCSQIGGAPDLGLRTVDLVNFPCDIRRFPERLGVFEERETPDPIKLGRIMKIARRVKEISRSTRFCAFFARTYDAAARTCRTRS
jgi:hypothetical protein